ncbi:hypothetical protein NFI96_025209, partial [Prochilodus magdalenae]
AVTSRPDCYWGRNCRTQVKAHHAIPSSVGTGRCPTGRCPTGRCHTGRCPTGRCPQDAAPQDAAHRTLPHWTRPHRTPQCWIVLGTDGGGQEVAQDSGGTLL